MGSSSGNLSTPPEQSVLKVPSERNRSCHCPFPSATGGRILRSPKLPPTPKSPMGPSQRHSRRRARGREREGQTPGGHGTRSNSGRVQLCATGSNRSSRCHGWMPNARYKTTHQSPSHHSHSPRGRRSCLLAAGFGFGYALDRPRVSNILRDRPHTSHFGISL